MYKTKKNKIINDPIYGFITLEKGIILDLIEHPYFQRLRRISQLGLSYLVYPGAYHTRFHHAIGSMFLMNKAIIQLKNKGHKINKEESNALKIAILLHDIGHGPFSHALENSIVDGFSHEDISYLFMKKLNKEFKGKLSLAIQIFQDQYHKKYFHQLVSSQIDMDRLDYLKRDSFFTGVVEGNIGMERIINMLNVVNDQLVVEEKGIYSIEKFLIARRLMYWQVYLHKTVVSLENTLIQILKRAKEINTKEDLPSTESIKLFLGNNFNLSNFKRDETLIDDFSKIDDHDIYICLKHWANHSDLILSNLSKRILNRKPLKIITQNVPFSTNQIKDLKEQVVNHFKINKKDSRYLVFTGKISNHTYQKTDANINIMMKNGEIKDITEASDQFNINILSKKDKKYFLCYPKIVSSKRN